MHAPGYCQNKKRKTRTTSKRHAESSALGCASVVEADGQVLHCKARANSMAKPRLQSRAVESRGAVLLPAGPRTLAETLDALGPMVNAIVSHLKLCLGQQGYSEFGNASWKKIVLTTTYSGMDFPGTTMSMLKEHFLQAGVNFEFELYAATDIDKACRQALLSKKDPPAHVFGSILHRIPTATWQNLQIELESHRYKVMQKLSQLTDAEKGDRRFLTTTRAKLIQEHSQQFVRHAQLHLAQVDMSAFERSWCYSCQQVCSAKPKRDPNCLYVEVAGTTCVAYSLMSATKWMTPHFHFLYGCIGSVIVSLTLCCTSVCQQCLCSFWTLFCNMGPTAQWIGRAWLHRTVWQSRSTCQASL